jgi:hypothetical protein
MYADWLDDHGQPARAEFIRLQLQQAQARLTRDTAFTAATRAADLLRQHFLQWVAHLPVFLHDHVGFERGFVSHLECNIYDLLGVESLPLEPVESLLIEVEHFELNWVSDQARLPCIELPLRALTVLCHIPIGRFLTVALNRLGPYPRLQSLHLQDRGMVDHGLELLDPQIFPVLTHLDLSQCDLDDSTLTTFLDTEWPSRLEQLLLPREQLSLPLVGWLTQHLGHCVRFV